jgi:hypothetical protein
VGSTNATRRLRQADFTTDHHRPDLRYLSRAEDEAAGQIGHAGALSIRSLIAGNWKPGDNYNDIYTGWAYPPKTCEVGGIGLPVVRHCVQKYGLLEVESWMEV